MEKKEILSTSPQSKRRLETLPRGENMSPLESYGCSVCGRQAPKELREHGKYRERMAWLRRHYGRRHPYIFKWWYRREI